MNTGSVEQYVPSESHRTLAHDDNVDNISNDGRGVMERQTYESVGTCQMYNKIFNCPLVRYQWGSSDAAPSI
jgi:hypothetical protein